MDSDDDLPDDPVITPLLQELDRLTIPPLSPELDAAIARIIEMSSGVPPWLSDRAVIAFFDAQLSEVSTRGANEGAFEAVRVEVLPSSFDQQVNVSFGELEIHVEVDVDPAVGELWATLDIGEERIAAPFAVSQIDDRLRVARLPLGRPRPIRLGIAERPNDSG